MELSFTLPFLLGIVFFLLERGGMPLHDEVGINCKKGAATENQGVGVKYVG